MKSEIEKILHQRINDNECLICARKFSNKKEIVEETLFLHSLFGDVQICEKHIKQSGNDE